MNPHIHNPPFPDTIWIGNIDNRWKQYYHILLEMTIRGNLFMHDEAYDDRGLRDYTRFSVFRNRHYGLHRFDIIMNELNNRRNRGELESYESY